MKIFQKIIICCLGFGLTACQVGSKVNANLVGSSSPYHSDQPSNSNQTGSGSQAPSTLPAPQPPAPVPTPQPQPTPQPTPPPALPASVDHSVAFASQAPFGVWDELHGEACEEASIAMAVKYFRKEPMSAHVMEQEILKLVDWEEKQGIPIDANAVEMVRIIKEVYGMESRIVETPTLTQMKQEIAAGNLIIIPVAGRLLGNPNFRGDGPIYHVLVLRGYTATEFITNDPGTRKGEGYRYTHNVILNALHDWDHALAADGMTDAEMAKGRKVMIVIPSSQ